MSYTDAEMMMATQIAYLDYDGRHRGAKRNCGELVDAILQSYGTYDQASGTYVLKDGISGAEKAQFETAQNIIRLSEQNHVDSWRSWSVVDGNHQPSGYYGCLIDTGDGNAIVGCRGSESYDLEAVVKDWVIADAGRLNNPLTKQQADATEYMKYLYEEYGDQYDSFCFTGHSLGGSLATHAALTAPDGMTEKTDKVISFDGPGFSDEYLAANRERIRELNDKIYHYEYSWVGSLLFQPPGIHDEVIKAHNDESQDNPVMAELWRHATYNVEFDEDGNVMEGEQSGMQKILGLVSKQLELTQTSGPTAFFAAAIGGRFFDFLIDFAQSVKEGLESAAEYIKEKADDLYNNFISLMVSGDYEIHTGQMNQMADDLKMANRSLNEIAAQVDEVRRTLPYDSLSALYLKHCLWNLSGALKSEGRKADKISAVTDRAVSKYHKGDQKVSALFY